MASFDIGFVLFPGVTQLDLTGPYEVLCRLGTPASLAAPSAFAEVRTHVAAASPLPVTSDRGLALLPTCSFEDCPPLDLLCVPGGAGVAAAIADPATVGFVRRQAAGARSSPRSASAPSCSAPPGCCAAAPRRPTGCTDLCRWSARRTGRAGSCATAASSPPPAVSAGIDFAFALVAEIAGAEVAEAIQLGIEYDPAPPFDFRPSRQRLRSRRRADAGAPRRRPRRHPRRAGAARRIPPGRHAA